MVEQPEVEHADQGKKETRFSQNISLKSHPYIGDHKVGKFALFPAAGFVEIMLAALSTSASQEYPLVAENIVVKAPLVIEEVLMKEVHTISATEDSSLVQYSVHSKEPGSGGSWAAHATGSGSLYLTTEQILEHTNEAEVVHFSVPEANQNGQELYKKLQSLGYNFGLAFRTIGKLWGAEGGSQLAEIRIPNEVRDKQDVLHPLLIDAVIQASLIFTMGGQLEQVDGLYLPVGLKRIVVLGPSAADSAEGESVFYIKSWKNGEGTITNRLYSAGGLAIAKIEGVEFVKTNLHLLERNLELAKNREMFPLPPLGITEWISAPERIGEEPLKQFRLGQLENELNAVCETIAPPEKIKDEDLHMSGYEKR